MVYIGLNIDQTNLLTESVLLVNNTVMVNKFVLLFVLLLTS